VFQQGFRHVDLENIPSLLLPKKSSLGFVDNEKAFCLDFKNSHDIFELRQVNRENGCMTVGSSYGLSFDRAGKSDAVSNL